MNWLCRLGIIWVLGAVVLLARVVVLHTRALLRARRAAPLDDPEVLALLHQCRRAVGARRVPRLVVSPDGAGPALIGLLRPMLLIPERATERLSRAELRFVLLHELVHLRRLDVLSEWLLTLVQLVHWFNPLLWLAASRCRADRELACDAAVLALAGEDARADYGRTILRLATELASTLASRRFPAAVGIVSVGILTTRSPLERRLRMIADPARKSSRWPAGLVALLALALVACTNAQSPSQGAKADATAPANATTTANASAPATTSGPAGVPDGDVLNAPDEWREVRASRDRTVAEEIDDPKNAVVRKQLDQVIPELAFDAVPFGEVVDKLRELTGANIFINWRALENAGVDKKAPVSARFRNIRFAKALAIVLDTVSGGTVPLGYTVDDGVITVSTGEDLDKNTVTRVYDVRDLIIPIPNHDDAPAIGLHFEGPKPAPEPGAGLAKEAAGDRTRQELIDEVIRLITETVSPHSWRDAGGSIGSIRELQGQFIVTQTPENHVEIVKLLDMLRRAREVQITVEARFITIDDAVLKALPADLRTAVEGELRAAKDPVPATGPTPREGEAPAEPRPPQPKNPSETILLSAKQVDQLLAAVQASRESTIISAPRLTLFNGQSAYVLISTQRAYAADYITIQDKDGSTRFEPQIGTAQSGMVLWARATAGADRTFATVSVRPRLTQLAGMEKVPWDRSPPGMKLTVERPRLLASELATTASIPDGQTLLLGGLKGYFPPEAQAPDAKFIGRGIEGKPSNVLLLVRPKLIIQREVEAKRFPLKDVKEKAPAPARTNDR